MIQEINCTVSEIFQETPDTKTFRIKKPFSFIPGQFAMVSINLPHRDKPEKRAYSFSSCQTKEYMDLTIKKEKKGLVSKYFIEEVKKGTELVLKGPYGLFKLEHEGVKEVVLIGGGSGIAPMRSIIQYILDNKKDIKLTLFFSVKKKEDIIFEKELEKYHQQYENFNYILTVTNEENKELNKGRISLDMIQKHTMNPDKYFICGPHPMVNSIRGQLMEKGVKKKDIKVEKW